jgi:hypothetical protein
MNTAQQQLIRDIEGYESSQIAPMLRTVASLNPTLSRAEFVAAAVSTGVNAATATKQFYVSRKLDMGNGAVCDGDGRITNDF